MAVEAKVTTAVHAKRSLACIRRPIRKYCDVLPPKGAIVITADLDFRACSRRFKRGAGLILLRGGNYREPSLGASPSTDASRMKVRRAIRRDRRSRARAPIDSVLTFLTRLPPDKRRLPSRACYAFLIRGLRGNVPVC